MKNTKLVVTSRIEKYNLTAPVVVTYNTEKDIISIVVPELKAIINVADRPISRMEADLKVDIYAVYDAADYSEITSRHTYGNIEPTEEQCKLATRIVKENEAKISSLLRVKLRKYLLTDVKFD